MSLGLDSLLLGRLDCQSKSRVGFCQEKLYYMLREDKAINKYQPCSAKPRIRERSLGPLFIQNIKGIKKE